MLRPRPSLRKQGGVGQTGGMASRRMRGHAGGRADSNAQHILVVLMPRTPAATIVEGTTTRLCFGYTQAHVQCDACRLKLR